jgi:thioredoxin 2
MAEATTVKCEHCGRTNRLPAVAEGSPRCGACGKPLPWIVDATDDDFAEIADKATVPVLVDMWATWCGPCRMVSPALERVAREFAGRIKLVKVDIDRSPNLAAAFTVRAVPTLLVLHRGKVVAERAGAVPLHELRSWVRQAVEAEHERSEPV